MPIVIWGGTIIFNINNYNNLWYFGLITFSLQLLVVLYPVLIKFYTYLCSLRTPCCCVKDYHYEQNENKEIQLNKNERILV